MRALGVLLAAALLGGCSHPSRCAQIREFHYPACYEPVSDMRSKSVRLRGDVYQPALSCGFRGCPDVSALRQPAIPDAVSGSTVSFLQTEHTRSMSQERRFELYGLTMDEDSGNLSMAVAAARFASVCYGRVSRKLADDYRAGRIGPGEMAERAAEIRDGAGDGAAILRKYSGVADANLATYELVARSEDSREKDRPSRGRVARLRNRAGAMRKIHAAAYALAGELDGMRSLSAAMLQSPPPGPVGILPAPAPEAPETGDAPCRGRH
jgi:hypothetical protein